MVWTIKTITNYVGIPKAKPYKLVSQTLMQPYNKYFEFRFGLVKTINTYLRLKYRVVCGKISNLKSVLFEFTLPNPSLILFFYNRNL